MKKIVVLFIIFVSLFCSCAIKTQPEQPATPTEVPTIFSTGISEPTLPCNPEPTLAATPIPTLIKMPESRLDILHEEIAEAGALCGVAFLGYFEGDYSEVMAEWKKEGIYEEYPFLAEITDQQVIQCAGGEWFLMIPLDEYTKVKVCESFLDETDFMLKPGKELYRGTEGALVLIRGNISDIFPSTVVVIEKENYTISYSPSLSLKDGSVAEGEGIYNID